MVVVLYLDCGEVGLGYVGVGVLFVLCLFVGGVEVGGVLELFLELVVLVFLLGELYVFD